MILKDKLAGKQIILASQSPRRKLLMHDLGLTFEIIVSNIDESNFDDSFSPNEITGFLAQKKAEAISNHLKSNTIIIAADTIVFLNNQIIGKPTDLADAYQIIQKLSGQKHTVISGVCIMSLLKTRTFSVSTDVYFRQLHNEEIKFYVETYKPLDKAGAYGIQEWIGLIGLSKIDGSYHNVMGLPTAELNTELLNF